MAVHSLKKIQKIPASLDDVWDFFTDPVKLPLITPPEMNFKTLSSFRGERIYSGQIIEYTLRPLLGIPVYWMTEITHVSQETYFVDEQRRGPYSLWHHQHHFQELDDGVEMTDIVHYRIPFGIAGNLINTLLVGKKLEDLFQYRYRRIEELFR